MTDRSCGTCQWADATVLDDGDFALQCRRWPPQITIDDDGPIQCWPHDRFVRQRDQARRRLAPNRAPDLALLRALRASERDDHRREGQ